MTPKEYWSFNVKFVSVLLSIWAFVSFGCGMVFAPWLDQFKLIGTEYPLGFWFAQQGSIYVFVMLIITYVIVMNRVDKKYKGSNQ